MDEQLDRKETGITRNRKYIGDRAEDDSELEIGNGEQGFEDTICD